MQETHRAELSADEKRSNKRCSWVSKSCNTACPNDEQKNLLNGLNHPLAELQNFAGQKAALRCIHASETIFPLAKCFPSRFKNSIPEHKANNIL
jgi:hypothetical protein